MKKIISGLLALALVAGGVAAPVTDIAGVKTAVTASAEETIQVTDVVVSIYYRDHTDKRHDIGSGKYDDKYGNYYFEIISTDINAKDMKDIGFEFSIPNLPDDKKVTFNAWNGVEYSFSKNDDGDNGDGGNGGGFAGGRDSRDDVLITPDNATFTVEWKDFYEDAWNNYDSFYFNLSSMASDFNVSDYTPSDKTDISKATVKAANKTYSGKALKPAVTVTLDGKTLKSGTDYSVAYKNNVNCGKATFTIKGKGEYSGTKTGSFIIKPAKVASKKLTSPKSKTVKLTWTKAKGGVTGYQIVLGLNKKMTSGKKTVWVKKAAAAAKTVKGLKAKKTYYAKVRAYKQVGSKKYYGAWSTIRKAKCK